jgi:hypothetical protein
MGYNDDADEGEDNGIANHYFQTTTTILDAILVDEDDQNNDNVDRSCCILRIVLVTNDLRSKVWSKN